MDLHLSQFAGAALVDVTLKALLTVGLAALVVKALRTAATSTRHAVWLTAIVVLLALPSAALALPQISLPLLPRKSTAAATELDALPLEPPARPQSQIPASAASDVSSDAAFIATAPPAIAATRSWSAAQ